jgi:PhzF family phenazine biosynthesis protein
MNIKTYIIDAFTHQPFKGNPAGVCLPDDTLEESMMQAIATELNHSETAFLGRDKSDSSRFSIRYFTPTTEIDFCGHATLAAAKLLLEKPGISQIEFLTNHDLTLHAMKEGNEILMKFPLYKTIDYNPPSALYRELGVSVPVNVRYTPELNMLIIEVSDRSVLLNLRPDYAGLKKISTEIKEVVVTTRSTDGFYDFYSRCFCPWIGIDEDPVTGASHSVLAKYWGDILSKTEMTAYQSSKRGGSMKLRITGPMTLEVIGNARIVLEGMIEA